MRGPRGDKTKRNKSVESLELSPSNSKINDFRKTSFFKHLHIYLYSIYSRRDPGCHRHEMGAAPLFNHGAKTNRRIINPATTYVSQLRLMSLRNIPHPSVRLQNTFVPPYILLPLFYRTLPPLRPLPSCSPHYHPFSVPTVFLPLSRVLSFLLVLAFDLLHGPLSPFSPAFSTTIFLSSSFSFLFFFLLSSSFYFLFYFLLFLFFLLPFSFSFFFEGRQPCCPSSPRRHFSVIQIEIQFFLNNKAVYTP